VQSRFLRTEGSAFSTTTTTTTTTTKMSLESASSPCWFDLSFCLLDDSFPLDDRVFGPNNNSTSDPQTNATTGIDTIPPSNGLGGNDFFTNSSYSSSQPPSTAPTPLLLNNNNNANDIETRGASKSGGQRLLIATLIVAALFLVDFILERLQKRYNPNGRHGRPNADPENSGGGGGRAGNNNNNTNRNAQRNSNNNNEEVEVAAVHEEERNDILVDSEEDAEYKRAVKGVQNGEGMDLERPRELKTTTKRSSSSSTSSSTKGAGDSKTLGRAATNPSDNTRARIPSCDDHQMTTSASSSEINNNSNSANNHNNRQYGSNYSSTARKSSSSVKDDNSRMGPGVNTSMNSYDLATVQEVVVASPTEEEPKKMAAIPSVAAAVVAASVASVAVAPGGDDDNGTDGVRNDDDQVSFLVDSGDMMQHWKSFNTSTLGRLESWAELKQVCVSLVIAILFSWTILAGKKESGLGLIFYVSGVLNMSSAKTWTTNRPE
jgi:hypothetical protein